MSHSTNETVECPLCGERFDPTAAGGWCTNSDCGEWQHEAVAEATDNAGGRDDGSETAPDTPTDAPDTPSESEAGPETQSEGDTAEPDGQTDRAVADTEPDPEPVADTEPADDGPSEDETAGEPDEGLFCPSCGASVAAEHSFCASCGEALGTHRLGDDGSATGAESTTDERPESLVLVARNREVQVWEGDTVGKTLRSIVMNTGGDGDDAVRIHREHVKFAREDGRFHLVALGQNPTVVNGESLEKGDRVPVSPGDRIELSGVVRVRVEAP